MARPARQPPGTAPAHADDYVARLGALAATLVVADTSADLGDALVERGVGALGAVAGALALVGQDGSRVELVRATGCLPAGGEDVPGADRAAPSALDQVARTAMPVWLARMSDAQLEQAALPRAGIACGALLPLLVEERVLGVLALGFASPHDFDASERAYLTAAARMCAAAVKRARLHEAEQAALAEADAARQRLTFLAAASEALASTLDYEHTLAHVARMAVPALADWCAVDLLEPDGSLRRVAAVHADPARAEAVRRLAERFPSIASTAPHTAKRVVREGRPWFDPDVAEARFVAEARSAEHLALLRQLGFRGEIVAPLTSREQVLGTLTLVRGPGRPRYSEDDLTLAVELAHRCALAIDNARLYQDAQEQMAIHVQLNHELRAVVSAERAARARATLLATLSQTLATARLDRAAVLHAVARHTAERIGDLCVVALVDADAGVLIPVAVEHANPDATATARAVLAAAPIPVGQGAAGRVAQTGEPLLSNGTNANAAPRPIEADPTGYGDHPSLSNMLIVPLRVSERIIGTLALSRDRVGEPYTEDDLDLVQEIALRAAIAIDNAELHAAAETAVQVRDEFMAVAAHDLRTPIASLRAYAQLALARLGASAPDLERVRLSITRVVQQTDRLTGMIERLLDVARVQGGKVRLERVRADVGSLVQGAVAALRAAHPDRSILVRTEPVMAEVDPVRLEQVVVNLIDNALKFSPASVPVEVEVQRCEPELVRIAVRDHGPGIPPAHRARVFERYYQAQERRRGAGVGLGLYISRHFVELHGGRIGVESPADGQGSSFVVVLPRRVQADLTAEDGPGPTASANPRADRRLAAGPHPTDPG